MYFFFPSSFLWSIGPLVVLGLLALISFSSFILDHLSCAALAGGCFILMLAFIVFLRCDLVRVVYLKIGSGLLFGGFSTHRLLQLLFSYWQTNGLAAPISFTKLPFVLPGFHYSLLMMAFVSLCCLVSRVSIRNWIRRIFLKGFCARLLRMCTQFGFLSFLCCRLFCDSTGSLVVFGLLVSAIFLLAALLLYLVSVGVTLVCKFAGNRWGVASLACTLACWLVLVFPEFVWKLAIVLEKISPFIILWMCFIILSNFQWFARIFVFLICLVFFPMLLWMLYNISSHLAFELVFKVGVLVLSQLLCWENLDIMALKSCLVGLRAFISSMWENVSSYISCVWSRVWDCCLFVIKFEYKKLVMSFFSSIRKEICRIFWSVMSFFSSIRKEICLIFWKVWDIIRSTSGKCWSTFCCAWNGTLLLLGNVWSCIWNFYSFVIKLDCKRIVIAFFRAFKEFVLTLFWSSSAVLLVFFSSLLEFVSTTFWFSAAILLGLLEKLTHAWKQFILEFISFCLAIKILISITIWAIYLPYYYRGFLVRSFGTCLKELGHKFKSEVMISISITIWAIYLPFYFRGILVRTFRTYLKELDRKVKSEIMLSILITLWAIYYGGFLARSFGTYLKEVCRNILHGTYLHVKNVSEGVQCRVQKNLAENHVDGLITTLFFSFKYFVFRFAFSHCLVLLAILCLNCGHSRTAKRKFIFSRKFDKIGLLVSEHPPGLKGGGANEKDVFTKEQQKQTFSTWDAAKRFVTECNSKCSKSLKAGKTDQKKKHFQLTLL